jgi:predicted GIY-YIG superfamily endonuclease
VSTVTIHADETDVVRIEADTWNGELIRMSRRAFLEAKTIRRASHPAVYVLYNDRFEAAPRELYVGHTGDVADRLLNHHDRKAFWTMAIIFRSKDDVMNIAHTQTIEHRFIELARIASRYVIDNGNDSAPAHLGADDAERVSSFVAGAREVLRIVGIDIFAANDDAVFTYSGRISDPLHQARLTLTAIDPPRATILAGSIIVPYDSASSETAMAMADPPGSIIRNGKKYTFTADTVLPVELRFEIPGAVFGISAGKWINDQGKSLADIIKARRKMAST